MPQENNEAGGRGFNPWLAGGVGAGLGSLLGALTTSRNPRETRRQRVLRTLRNALIGAGAGGGSFLGLNYAANQFRDVLENPTPDDEGLLSSFVGRAGLASIPTIIGNVRQRRWGLPKQLRALVPGLTDITAAREKMRQLYEGKSVGAGKQIDDLFKAELLRLQRAATPPGGRPPPLASIVGPTGPKEILENWFKASRTKRVLSPNFAAYGLSPRSSKLLALKRGLLPAALFFAPELSDKLFGATAGQTLPESVRGESEKTEWWKLPFKGFSIF